jgi:2-polyprenyl-3-methyl-5-hydroxy-6-metoxy-1,4-benzoquinol methylase
MVSAEQHGHLSDKNYWSEKYAGKLPRAVDVGDRSLRNYFRRYQHKEFSRRLAEYGFGKGSRLLEVGCGGSIWLPYFAREHGFEVTGLDYSEKGCAAAEYVLRRDGVDGKVVCGDLFDPPEEMLGAFDVVTSFGVVEHFQSTAGAVAACARFLRPGGVIMTIIPNVAGLSGAGVKFFDPKLYSIHVPMTKEQLGRAHSEAGLEVLDCRYLTPAWFSDWSVPAGDRRRGRRLLRNLLWYPTAALSAGAWVLDDLIGNRLPGSRWFSPWAICWARRPAD